MMDATASSDLNLNFSNNYDVLNKFVNDIPIPNKNQTVIKYTKLPESYYNTKEPWPLLSNNLHPRTRRVVAIEEANPVRSSRSLKHPIPFSNSKIMSSTYTKRKIVTIAEDEENSIYHRLSKKSPSIKLSHRSTEPDKDEKSKSNISSSRISMASRYSKETKTGAKISNIASKKDVEKPLYRSKFSNTINPTSPRSIKGKTIKDTTHNKRSANVTSKISLSESEQHVCLIKKQIMEKSKSNISNIKSYDSASPRCKSPCRKPKNNDINMSTLPINMPNHSILKEIKAKHKPVTLIRVPIDEPCHKKKLDEDVLIVNQMLGAKTMECSTEVEREFTSRDMNVATDDLKQRHDQETQIESFTDCMCDNTTGKVKMKDQYDDLYVPDVSLTKCKYDSTKEDLVNLYCKSLPNLRVPHLQITPSNDINKVSSITSKSLSNKNTSYIIGRATLTYTTQQKIDFHVVSSNDDTTNLSQSNLDYPMNVLSIFKKEIKSQHEKSKVHISNKQKQVDKCRTVYEQHYRNEYPSINSSYILKSDRLVKPSEMIDAISLNNSVLQCDYISEQFKRELNFIDSFFESLQYLENLSLSNKCYIENRVENWVSNTGLDVINTEYTSLFSKLDTSGINDNSETMANRSLCLLNLLIRDEQRRAKNLLFVLKMREDALKDFTKSQILWLENKKKQDNTDISTLKKKQRGALLKLQHECGEMQRMRKTLLSLSEKRKAGLMKTKKNIELKLNNSVNVDQILLGKKKLKRTSIDRSTAPLKCFDLLSSGCEDNSVRLKNDVSIQELPVAEAVTSVEKCVQTSVSVLGSLLIDRTSDSSENFITVDGGYLNILFHNLSSPQIFSNSKQYEVNEEALKNIVNSSNSNHADIDTGALENLLEQIKNKDSDCSSTPSTARSLVEEFDDYFKGFIGDERSGSSDEKGYDDDRVNDSFDSRVTEVVTDSETTLIRHDTSDECICESKCTEVVLGPVPLPVSTSSEVSDETNDSPVMTNNAAYSDNVLASEQTPCSKYTSLTPVTPAQYEEAEELRKQQLAIEREIKALEQQQCMLIVREIPDKPPPPYTPPNDAKTAKSPKQFVADEFAIAKLSQLVTDPDNVAIDETDAFDVFLKDFSEESILRNRIVDSEFPWEPCNILPQKPKLEMKKLSDKIIDEFEEVLTPVKPTVVPGVCARRSDHIDDILFAEWRRCEPEWTSLHVDEIVVKNIVFESIFQKVLTETIDNYKEIVLNHTN